MHHLFFFLTSSNRCHDWNISISLVLITINAHEMWFLKLFGVNFNVGALFQNNVACQPDEGVELQWWVKGNVKALT